MKIRKTHLVFISIILFEILLLGVLYLFFQNPCGSACNTQSFINPFGLNQPETCITVCEQTQHFLFYPLADLTILTILGYLVFIFRRKMKGGKK
ncbi:MAG: hypothetical protein ACOC1P_01165 [Minisyncoccales bacterium]